MYKTKFIPPYRQEKGSIRTNIPQLSPNKKQSGVYIIKDEKTSKILYVGFSESQLYKTVFRHFQKWIDISRTEKTRFTYEKFGYLVRVIFTTPQRASKLEMYLIMNLKPVDNTRKYENYLSQKEVKFIESELNSIKDYNKDLPF